MKKRVKANSEIYVDNAATSYPKPPGVLKAVSQYARHIGASAGRGAYPRAVQTGEMIVQARRLLARLLKVEDPDRIIFTFNASDGLNIAIHGLHWNKGDRAVISMLEHNSVLRPLNALARRIGIEIVKVPCSKEGFIDMAALRNSLNARTRLVSVLHASNVMGVITPVEEIAHLCRKKGVPCLVDAAQSVGSLPVYPEEWGIDMLAFPGHKALLGPLGTGGLYIRPGLDLNTLKQGGTGSISEQEVQPDFYPDKFEPGSHNAFGIAGLHAGVSYILKKGISSIRAQEQQLTEYFLNGLRCIPDIVVYGPRDAHSRVAVISINATKFSPAELADRLYKQGKIMTRYGIHCAPVAHQTIGTYPSGTVRFSFGVYNTLEQVDKILKTLKDIVKEKAASSKLQVASNFNGKTRQQAASCK